ncbi:hypothetical protein ACFLY0_01540 [Patescibacteria group bacterium]
MREKTHSFISFIAVSALLIVGFSFIDKVDAGASHNVSGFAWSDTVGWISFNNFSDNSSIDYGVNIDVNGTGDFSGYAWSDNIGWIDFAPTAGYPEAPNHGVRLETDNTVTGWAKAIAGDDFADGWDGWIKMSDESNPNWAGNGVRLSGEDFIGYAWGSEVVGWIDFAPAFGGVRVNPDGIPECSDSIDNDGDLLIDYPNDPGCSSGSDDDEIDSAVSSCSDGIDNDGDGFIDYPSDPGCSSDSDDDESDVIAECSDGIDNDGDTLVDYPNDPGCASAADTDETDTGATFSLAKSGNIAVTVVSGSGDTTSSQATITVVPTGGFADNVALSVQSVVPAISGASYTFTDTLLDDSEYGTGSVFSVTVPDTISSGTHTIELKGSGSGLDRTVDVVLVINKTDPGYGEF